MALFGHECPVEDRERDWIQDNLEWFRGQFGDGPLSAPVILPTSEYFPPPYSGSDEDVRGAVRRVAGYMGVQAEVGVEFSDDLDHGESLQRLVPMGISQVRGAAGEYTASASGSPVITIDRANTGAPARLLAVIAHELGHVRLLGEGRVPADRKDQEPLTDLLTIYLGMGIFSANAAFDFSRLPGYSGFQRVGGWQAQQLGYLTEQMFGYGLACFASMRGEPDPGWARYLDTNPRVYLKHGLRYLSHSRPQ
ncbi:MAG TPA: hypothetical protein VIX86_07860 [Streptosporangiaceae bacterium]